MKKQMLIGILSVASAAGLGTFHTPETIVPPAATAAASASVSATIFDSSSGAFGWPIDDAEGRVTKKPFGLKIEPGLSPVPNDRFAGYHVGVDFETTEAESDADVPIYAICDGKLLFKEFARGYGGLAAQECVLNETNVTVLYGHLSLSSIGATAGDALVQGERIGVLGTGFSAETDGVRKHLHLGVHPGSGIDIRGYVQTEAETIQWLNALEYLPTEPVSS